MSYGVEAGIAGQCEAWAVNQAGKGCGVVLDAFSAGIAVIATSGVETLTKTVTQALDQYEQQKTAQHEKTTNKLLKPEVLVELITEEPEMVLEMVEQKPIQYTLSQIRRMHKTYVSAMLQTSAKKKGFTEIIKKKVPAKVELIGDVTNTEQQVEVEEAIHLDMLNPTTGEHLEIQIKPDGDFTAEVKDITGPECKAILEKFMRGMDVKIQDRHTTQAYYQKEVNHVRQQIGK